MNRKEIHGTNVEYDGEFFERVVFKPLIGSSQRVPYIKLDDVYIYFPFSDKIIISKEDINSFKE